MAAANQAFEAKHPGTTVDVQYQTWGDHLSKFDATLAGGNTPDVIEMGNTEMTKYMAAGAFANLSPHKSHVRELRQLAQGPRRVGRLQRQDLRRPVLRGLARRHVPRGPVPQGQARRPDEPRAVHDRGAEARKDEQERGFSPVYIAGTDWYFAMSFVYDYGGAIAALRSGKWVGRLESAKARAGLSAYKAFFNAASRASKTGTENRPQPYNVYAQGQAASIVGPGMVQLLRRQEVHEGDEAVRDAEPHQGPGHARASSAAPTSPFPPARTTRRWRPTGSGSSPARPSEKGLQAKGNIPNATSLLGNSVNERAAKRSWFVPTAKNWVNVENGNILRTMLARILTGQGDHQAGDRVGGRQHRAHAQPVATR